MCAPLQPASASRLSFVLWLLVLTAVITGSLLPGAIAARIPLAAAHLTDKDAHFLMYALLALLSLLAFDRAPTGLMCAVGAVPLGVALEFAQRLVPGRSFEIGDMIANTLGVCAGLVLAALLRRRKVLGV
ncbi:MAG: VanZ family protein [Bryobacteraceae bacterium]|jgi:VanZ family protein